MFRCIASIISYHIKRMAGFGSVMDMLVRIPGEAGDRFSQVETRLLFVYVIYVVLVLLFIEFYICMF